MESRTLAALFILFTAILFTTSVSGGHDGGDGTCEAKGDAALEVATNGGVGINRNDWVRAAESFYTLERLGKTCPW